jgi:DNA-3-methyladenine glycosylase I
MAEKKRCAWCLGDPIYLAYHDEEWGRPLHDDRALFEMLILEGAQAGLSWLTILRRREGYRRAFDRFDARRIARYDRRKVAALMRDAGIIRNRLKIAAAITNAQAFLQVQEEPGGFDGFLWSFVGGKPQQRARGAKPRVTSPEAEAMSRELKKRGFRFVGPTICYAFMQAVGMVNDHAPDCFCRAEVSRGR